MSHLRRIAIVGAIILILALIATIVPAALNPAPPSEERRRRDSRWVASSPYWLDRQACRFVGLCGVMHLRRDPAYVVPGSKPYEEDEDGGWVPRLELRKRSWEEVPRLDDNAAGGDHDDTDDDTARGRRTRVQRAKTQARKKVALKDVPSYVLEHAPLVHLFSGEHFWPADIMEHVRHLTPFYEDEAMNTTTPIDLASLHKLNGKTGLVTLRSNDDVEERPDWLYSETGIPVPFEPPMTEDDLVEMTPETGRRRQKDSTWQDVSDKVPLHHISRPGVSPGRKPPARNGQPFSASESPKKPARPENRNSTYAGYSSAPAVLVVVDKAPGIVDAYWFFFYSYNLGQTVAGLRFGNHVGDWEHCMIRFEDGIPRAVFLSEHEGGQAFEFGAMSRYRQFPDRPVIFSAVGSHAMYALPGKHPYVLPFGLLADETDRGPLWDPAKNTYAYHYDYTVDSGDPFLDDEGDDGDDHDGDGVKDQEARVPPGSSPDRSDQVIFKPGPLKANKSLQPAASNPDAPTSWFHFTGAWGDNLYPLADMRQWRLFMQYHYVTGPKGPKDKHLDREKMCPHLNCRLLDHLDPKGKWY